MISIEGLDKAEVLAALYNASKPLGLGILHYDPADMTRDEAANWIEKVQAYGQGIYFDYFRGRVMKVCLDGDVLDPSNYDRDNGLGAAAKAIERIRLASAKGIAP